MVNNMRDISIIKKKRQKSVQEQNALDKHSIKECAQRFRVSRDLPEALIECLEKQGIDTKSSILVWHDTMPFGGPTDAYRGEWVTPEKRFYSYEIYLDSKNENVTEIDVWEEITDKVELNEHKPGTGKTSGWLCIEVLNELNT
jgi:hypothetical protein